MTGATLFSAQELDTHGFLDGRITVAQPARGYRSGADTVLLAAACPARRGERVLDLGCGAGVASFCLGTRVAGLDLHGLEVQEGYAALAEANAGTLGIGLTVHRGDVALPPASLRAIQVDHVIANPPYYAEQASMAPADAGKDRAFREIVSLDAWIDCALRRLMQGGWLTMVHRVERLPEMLSGLAGRAGDIAIKPLSGRPGQAATRIVMRARKGANGGLRLLPPLTMHDGERHERDTDGFSPHAERILRDGEALDF